MIQSVLPQGDVGIAPYGSKYSGFSTWQSYKKSSVFAGNDVKNETNLQDCTRKGYAESVWRQSRQRLRSHDPCGVSQ